MNKVVIYQDKIMPYRVEIFNLLAKQVDLTIVYADGKLPDGIKFKTLKTEIKKIHGYTFLGKTYRKLEKQSDVVVLPLTQGIINTRIKLKSKKHVFWGIGVPAAYNCRFDSIGDYDTLSKLSKKANCCLFYSDYPIKKYKGLGYDTKKMFVASNTVSIPKINLREEKKGILFVGSLYPQKKIDELLIAYNEVYKKNISLPNLTIIGNGSMYDWIMDYCEENKIADKVNLVGEIYDENILKEYFADSLVCISPDQAGLSVLKSMGYGVPYVTHRNAITGGEIFNIIDGVNGVLYDSAEELVDIITDITDNKRKYIEYGMSAYDYYWSQRKPETMVKGFVDAIKFICEGKENEQK